jgi:hypothetical protein
MSRQWTDAQIQADLRRLRQLWREAAAASHRHSADKEPRQAQRPYERPRPLRAIRGWQDQEHAALELADECLAKARQLMRRAEEKGDWHLHKQGVQYLQMVHDFMRLAHLGRKEFDIDELRKRITQLEEKGTAP